MTPPNREEGIRRLYEAMWGKIGEDEWAYANRSAPSSLGRYAKGFDAMAEHFTAICPLSNPEIGGGGEAGLVAALESARLELAFCAGQFGYGTDSAIAITKALAAYRSNPNTRPRSLPLQTWRRHFRGPHQM